MSEFNLDREMNIRENIDAQGKKWTIYTERGRHFFFTQPEGARADAMIPPKFAGRWTKKMLLDEAIKLYVKDSWDHADQIAAKNARKAQAAKENKSVNAKEAQASEGGNSDADVVHADSADDKGRTGKSTKS